MLSPDGTRLYVRDDYHTENSGVSAVTVIDTTDNTILYTAQLTEVSDMEISPDGTVIYAADEDYWYPDVYVLDAATMGYPGNIRLTPLRGSLSWTLAMAMSSERKRAFVVVYDLDARGQSVSVVDTDPTSATYNTELGVITERNTAVSPDGTRRYVAQPDGMTVVVYDTATNTVIGSFITDANSGASIRSIAVAANGTLYITDDVDNKVYAVTVGNPTML